MDALSRAKEIVDIQLEKNFPETFEKEEENYFAIIKEIVEK